MNLLRKLRRVRQNIQAKTRTDDRGNFMIQLAVATVVSTILAGAAVSNFGPQRESAISAVMKSDLNMAATSTENYLNDNPTATAPSSVADLAPYGFRASQGNTVTVKAKTGGYLICISNPRSSDPDKFGVYDSTGGGVQQALQATC